MLNRILVITGAGISAESGIPTFRGAGGHWRNLDPLKLATPEGFAQDPALVWEWYRERRQNIRAAEPNAAHKAIVDLAKHAREFLLVTQNVDDLHARAGLPAEKMVQIHGDILETRCSRCHFIGEDVARCSQCGAQTRPGVVWFGEQLDSRKIDIVENFLARGDVDLALVIGTTALFGYIIDWATRATRQLIEINPEETSLTPSATESMREAAGIALPRLVAALIARPN
ncbi:MAG: Sir2 family NAD-dependent protein deacetylase [Spartobacteria bacterium]